MPFLAAVLALLLGLGTVGTVDPAQAQTACPSAGGQAISDPATIPAGDFVVVGGGWGHGVGMSQYGAQGGAKLGCSANEILQTYYPGVTVAQAPTLPESFRVSLWPERPGGLPVPAICLRAHTGSPVWHKPDATTVAQPNGTLWRVDVAPDGAFTIREFSSVDACRSGATGTGTEIWTGGTAGNVLKVPLDGPPIVQLTSKSTNTTYGEGRPYAHGTMEFFSVAGTAGATYLTLQIDTFDGRNALERYLRGLSEMPSSWEPAALQAQAITGRSYAQDKWEAFKGSRSGCRCDVYDSTSDQVYSGYLKESEAGFGHRWVAAVDATAGKTMRYANKTAVGYYSSSHGGYSESNTFVWGSTQVPYLKGVDDTRWDLNTDNNFRRWTQVLTKEQIAQAYGVGTVTSITLPEPKGLGGRIGDPTRGFGGVRIQGSTKTVTVSGDSFRSKFGMRSTLFSIRQNVVADPCAPNGSSTAQTTRLSGADRVATAVAVSQGKWSTGAREVVLATSQNFPDALASGSLAAAIDGPLLLTPTASLAQAVQDELKRLAAKTVWVLGGTGAVSNSVTDALTKLGYEVKRVSGGNRFETARRIALEPQPRTVSTVALAMDQDWAAAAAAGALAALPTRIPTLLVHADAVPAVTEQTLAELNAREVLLVGGTGSISTAVETRLRDSGYVVRRLAGETSYATSRAVAAEVLAGLPSGPVTLVAATGGDFPDALAAGALTAKVDGMLLLTPPCSLDDVASNRQFLADNRVRLADALLVGGRAALSELVREQLSAAIAD